MGDRPVCGKPYGSRNNPLRCKRSPHKRGKHSQTPDWGALKRSLRKS